MDRSKHTQTKHLNDEGTHKANDGKCSSVVNNVLQTTALDLLKKKNEMLCERMIVMIPSEQIPRKTSSPENAVKVIGSTINEIHDSLKKKLDVPK